MIGLSIGTKVLQRYQFLREKALLTICCVASLLNAFSSSFHLTMLRLFNDLEAANISTYPRQFNAEVRKSVS